MYFGWFDYTHHNSSQYHRQRGFAPILIVILFIFGIIFFIPWPTSHTHMAECVNLPPSQRAVTDCVERVWNPSIAQQLWTLFITK